MTKQVQGTVFKVYPKKWATGNTTYSVKLDGDPLYYRTPRGAKRGSDGDPLMGIAEPGAIISFSADPIDEKSAQIIAGTVKKVEAQPAAAVAGAASTGSGNNNAYATRDASIQYQSSRKDALSLVDILVRAAAVTLPAKAAAKLGALEALVDHYTSQFYQDIGTLGAIARANGTEEGEETAPAATSEEE